MSQRRSPRRRDRASSVALPRDSQIDDPTQFMSLPLSWEGHDEGPSTSIVGGPSPPARITTLSEGWPVGVLSRWTRPLGITRKSPAAT